MFLQGQTNWIGPRAILEVVAKRWSGAGQFFLRQNRLQAEAMVTHFSRWSKSAFCLNSWRNFWYPFFNNFTFDSQKASISRCMTKWWLSLTFSWYHRSTSSFFLADIPSGSYVSRGGIGSSYAWFSKVLNLRGKNPLLSSGISQVVGKLASGNGRKHSESLI